MCKDKGNGITKLKSWLHSRGRRVCAAVLCGSLVLCSAANGQIAALGGKRDSVDFKLHRVSLAHELEKAVEKGKTVEEDLLFDGESAGDYEELFAADGSLYELTASAKKKDGLKLQVFARLYDEPESEEAYVIDGSEEILFLISNTTDQSKTAVLHVDEQKSEPIRIVPRRAVTTSADASEDADEAEEPEAEAGEMSDGSEELEAEAGEMSDGSEEPEAEAGEMSDGSEELTGEAGEVLGSSEKLADESGEDTAGESEEDEWIPGTIYDAVLFEDHGAAAISVNAGDLGLDDPKYASESGSNAADGTNETDAGLASDSNAAAGPSGTAGGNAAGGAANGTSGNTAGSGIAGGAAGNTTLATASNAMKVYTAETDGFIVRVTAKDGTVPDGATLQVKELKEDDAETAEQFQEAKEALDAEETEYDGMIALDISFVDEEGNEMEPDGEVSVAIEMKMEALPEDADPESLAVQHLAETGDGTVEVKNVADGSEETEGTVAVAGDAAVAEFAVESFSTFTLTWSGSSRWSTYFQIKLTAVDESGVEIGEGDETASISANNTYAISSYVKAISGYSFVEARLESQTGEVITDFNTIQSGSGYDVSRSVKFLENGVSKRTYTYSRQQVSIPVYMVYRPSNITILDSIRTDGSLTAELDASVLETEGTTVTYSWEKKAEGSSKWEPVEDSKVGDQYILSEDGSKVNAALDEGARATYRVTATVTVMDADGNKNVSDYVAEYQVPYYASLQNGSFETPTITGNFYSQMSNADYKAQGGVWQTTGIGTGDKAGKDIEIIKTTNGINDAYAWYGTEEAADGKQFAELNAEADGSLYQDVLTVPGSSLNWWLSHRARGGEKSNTSEYDTMYLLIMSTEQAEEHSVDNQDAVKEVIANIEDYPGAAYWEFCSDDQSWHYYSSNGESEDAAGQIMDPYEVPEGQYLTRFFFVAGATASQSASMGNFLDEVGFDYDLPPARPGTGNLRITKQVVGLDSEAMKDYSVSFCVYQKLADGTEKEISGSPVQIGSFTERTGTNSDGSTYTYFEGSAFRTVTAGYGDGTTYLVREPEFPACDGYAEDTDKSDRNEETVVISDRGTGDVSFTNAYKQSRCTVKVKKQVTGNMGEIGDQTKTYSFTYSTTAGESGTFTLTDGAEKELQVTIGTNLTVTETDSRGYEVTWQRGNEDPVTTKDRTSFMAENVQPNETITCINTRNVVAPTGIGFHNQPFVLMIAFAVFGLVGSVLGSAVRKRRYRM